VITIEEIKHLQIKGHPFPIYFGEGCKKCRGTGLMGRTGIFEIMEFTSKIKSVLSEKTTLSSLYEVAKKEGLVNLRQMAMSKMREGITTYEEFIAVTGRKG
jgi:general secretion pathway protein E|tara:strand:+ start:285 stop:587 length:303 start_codon:yes stop_codon:yes gene_type:complete